MRKVFLTFLILVAIFPCLACPSLAGAKYSGGSGTAGNPYQIANIADLMTLANDTNDYNKCFIMTADIDLNPNIPGNMVFTTAVIARDVNGSNLIFDGITFFGVFDGAGHRIFNLNINGADVNDYLGLFGRTLGEIKNLGLENISITGGGFLNISVGLLDVAAAVTSAIAT